MTLLGLFPVELLWTLWHIGNTETSTNVSKTEMKAVVSAPSEFFSIKLISWIWSKQIPLKTVSVPAEECPRGTELRCLPCQSQCPHEGTRMGACCAWIQHSDAPRSPSAMAVLGRLSLARTETFRNTWGTGRKRLPDDRVSVPSCEHRRSLHFQLVKNSQPVWLHPAPPPSQGERRKRCQGGVGEELKMRASTISAYSWAAGRFWTWG